ncbi:DUF1330 domain-containing protein [Gammaproteobacteria bacterium]|nr:DUF1330 domain-containing protein [Gammaproteobacteria bacterium]
MPKGYWINHVEEIIDQEAFDRYVTKVNALIERGEFKMIAVGRVAKTQIGAKDMQFAAVVEFETFEKAMSFKSHPDYVDALSELGGDEIVSVKRTSCVVSG